MIWALPAGFGMYSFKKKVQKPKKQSDRGTLDQWLLWPHLLVLPPGCRRRPVLESSRYPARDPQNPHVSLPNWAWDVIPRSSQESESYQEKTPCVQVLVACTTQNPSRPSLLISRFGTTSLISHGKSADPSKYDSTPFEGLRKVRWAACQVVTRCLVKPQLPLLSVLSVYMTLWLYDLSAFRSFGHFSFAELSAALFFPIPRNRYFSTWHKAESTCNTASTRLTKRLWVSLLVTLQVGWNIVGLCRT